MADPSTPARPERPRGVQRIGRVERVEQLGPHLVRVHLGGPGIVELIGGADPQKLATTDKYVKMLFTRPELGLEPPYDLEALRETLPAEDMPSRRTYTVRGVDAGAGTIAIDFVVHGDEGIAGPWAARASAGDLVAMSGPGGGFEPTADAATRRLLVGDDAALPAIAAALEAMPADARGLALLEVEGTADELDLDHPAGIELRWIHRGGGIPGEALAEAVEALDPVTGAIEVFAHGERGAIKRIRGILTDGWGVERSAMSISAYWALGRAEDAFQAEKRTPIGAIFPD
jgi:NADPH-dependent ferric siderophore reductase